MGLILHNAFLKVLHHFKVLEFKGILLFHLPLKRTKANDIQNQSWSNFYSIQHLFGKKYIMLPKISLFTFAEPIFFSFEIDEHFTNWKLLPIMQIKITSRFHSQHYKRTATSLNCWFMGINLFKNLKITFQFYKYFKVKQYIFH